MSREVLLNVTSSAIELADATMTQTSPIASDGSAVIHAARRLDTGVPTAGMVGAGATDGRSSAAEELLRAMALSRRGSLRTAVGRLAYPYGSLYQHPRMRGRSGGERQVMNLLRNCPGALHFAHASLYCRP